MFDFSLLIVALLLLGVVAWGVRLAGRPSRRKSWIDEITAPGQSGHQK